jgi:dTDP-glucose 4,6-dehydratase
VKILVTVGTGFVGSSACRLLVGELGTTVVNVDKLTYAAKPASLRAIENHTRCALRRADICYRRRMNELLR